MYHGSSDKLHNPPKALAIEVRLTEKAPVHGHKITSGILCGLFMLEGNLEEKHSIKCEGAPNTNSSEPKYLTLQAQGYGYLVVDEIEVS